MPTVQRTIAACDLPPTVAPTPGPIVRRPPLAIYCECGALASAETAAGSVCDDCFTDCIECDGCDEAVDCVDATEINGEHYCESCAESFTCCEDCGGSVHRDDSTTIGGNEVCDSCRDDNYSRCDGCREYVANDDCSSDDNNTYCESCAESMYRCDGCNQFVSDGINYSCDNNTYCESCYGDNCFICEGCSESCMNEDQARYNYCQGCWDDLDCDARAAIIVENDHGSPSERIVYRDRPATGCPMPTNGHPEGERLRNYRTAAGELNRPESDNCCRLHPFNPLTNSCTRTGSYRTYGVELETSSCPGAASLSGRTIFSSKSDGSITGWEFNSDILKGDAGLDEIERFCELADDNSFAVDCKCGFHAHFGIGDLSDDERYNVVIAYWLFRDVWSAFVSEARRGRFHCAPIKWRPVIYDGTVNRIEYTSNHSHRGFDLRETRYTDFVEKLDRYCWLNPDAFNKYKTIEVRIHSGTINAKKINNWIIAHLRFIDFMSNLSREAIIREFHGKSIKTLFAGLLELMPSDVATYLTQRAELFGATIPHADLDLAGFSPVPEPTDNMVLAS